MLIKMPLLLALVFVMMLPLNCIGQNVIIRPNVFGPQNEKKRNDVCLYVVRQAQLCLQKHPQKCRQLDDLVAQLKFQCAPRTIAQIAPNPASFCECSDNGVTAFKIFFIIFAAGFLLAIAGLAAMVIFHFRRK